MSYVETLRNEYRELRALVIEFGEAGAREAAESYSLGVYLKELQS